MIDLDSAPSEAEEDKVEMHTNHEETREPQPVKAMENPKKKPGRKPRQKPELEAASVKDGMEKAQYCRTQKTNFEVAKNVFICF